MWRAFSNLVNAVWYQNEYMVRWTPKIKETMVLIDVYEDSEPSEPAYGVQ